MKTEIRKNLLRDPKTPYWQFDKDDQSREVYNKHMRKGETSSLNIYCARCDRDHWGPCECVICGKIGHDENDCPQLEDEKSYLDQLQKQEEERLKRKRAEPCWLCKKVGHVCPDPGINKEEKSRRPREIFCNFCEADGHLEQNCSIKREILEKPKLPEEYTDEQLEKEIEERVRKLRNIGNELNKKGKSAAYKEKGEPKDDINVEEMRRKTQQDKSKTGQGKNLPENLIEKRDTNNPPGKKIYNLEEVEEMTQIQGMREMKNQQMNLKKKILMKKRQHQVHLQKELLQLQKKEKLWNL